eukprot:TRINITY_DN15007_c0_g1_i1.p1 TRINITY_DN15007_c0_g1~~TRINITY_DN15007_c0_g1_i1.p1  ORF type:complete len:366 (-),score=52.29 TRINITY_DN15007_c0_g1_i1:382-1440(-)
MADESLVLSKMDSGYMYNRVHSTSVSNLARLLTQMYGVAGCVVTPSGMCAISSTLHALVNKHLDTKVNIVHGSELYTDTPKVCKMLARIHRNVTYHIVDVTDQTAILKLFTELRATGVIILFTESCSNPTSYIFDPALLPKIRSLCSSSKFYHVVDNTWLSVASFNPFQHGADIVVNSLTKYYSGGACIGGAVLCNSSLINDVQDWVTINGLHVSPHNADLIANALPQLEERIRLSDAVCRAVAQRLQQHSKVVQVDHPSLTSHPCHALAMRLFKYQPSVFTFRVRTAKKRALAVMANSTEIEHKTSFGAELCRTDPWPKQHQDLTACRVAIGFEDDIEQVVNGLTRMIDQM